MRIPAELQESKIMFRLVNSALLVAALVLTLAAGLLHGRISQRWRRDEQMLAAGQLLRDFPAQFGRWTMEDSFELSDVVVNELQCSGYFVRRYVDQETGQHVTVAVLVGPAGPISVHTPEICYSSRDWQLRGVRQASRVRDGSGNESEFWSLTMESTRLEGGLLRVAYAWTADGRWRAVESPRFRFAGQPRLFKFQLATALESGESEEEPEQFFLKQFVPAMNQYLFESPG